MGNSNSVYFSNAVSDQNFQQRKTLKKLSNTFSFSLVLQQGAALIASAAGIAVIVLMRMSLGEGVNLSSIINSDTSNSLYNFINLIVYFTYMFIPFIIISAVLRENPFEVIPYKIKHPQLIPAAIIIGLLFSILGDFYADYFDYLLSFFNLQVKLDAFDFPGNTPALIWYILSVSIFAPIMEEFIFRGLILNNLRKFGNFFAVVVSSLMFGVLHGNLSQTPFAFAVGLILGFAVIETGSIFTGIIIHCAINSVATIISGIEYYSGTSAANTVYLIYLSVIVILSIYFVFMLVRKGFFKGFKRRYSNVRISAARAFGVFAATPGFIIFMVLSIVNMAASLSKR